jgi:hypothetical protein
MAVIHKVETKIKVNNDLTVTQTFEQVNDTSEEAKDFGLKANELSMSFLEGWGNYEHAE